MEHISQVALKKLVRNTISNIGICKSVKTLHPKDWIFFNELFKRHPDYPTKIENVIDMEIGTQGKYFCTRLIRSDGTKDLISLTGKCITGKTKDELYLAMRNAIEPQIKKFYTDKQFASEATGEEIKCECCEATYDIQVDHYDAEFSVMYKLFIQNKKVPSSFKSLEPYGIGFKDDDKEFENKWCEYHKKNTKLRLLCSRCNKNFDNKRVNHYMSRDTGNIIRKREVDLSKLGKHSIVDDYWYYSINVITVRPSGTVLNVKRQNFHSPTEISKRPVGTCILELGQFKMSKCDYSVIEEGYFKRKILKP